MTAQHTARTAGPRLTKKRLDAIIAALNSALSGEIGEGDFTGMNAEDFERALEWAQAEKSRRAALAEGGGE